MDKFRLIAEIRKRPPIWNKKKKLSQQEFYYKWDEVSKIMGCDVKTCKKVWRNIRSIYSAETKRCEQRIEMDIENEEYDPNKDYTTKWVYFKHLTFLNETKLNASNDSGQELILIDNENSVTDSEIKIDNVTVEDSDEEQALNSSNREIRDQNSERVTRSEYATSSNTSKSDKQYPHFIATDDVCIKVEPELEMLPENRNPTKKPRLINNNSKETNSYNKKSLEIENIQRNNNTNAKDAAKVPLPDINDSDYYYLLSFTDHLKSLSQLENLKFRAKMSELILSILTTSLSDDKLKTQEHNMQMETLVDIANQDSNFLISFWPYMKLMTQLQNLQFRSKIPALMLNILSSHGNTRTK